MPAKERFHTKYPGVYYIMGTSVSSGKPEKIFYIYYRKNAKQIEEKAGREIQDQMTPAQANRIRSSRIESKELSNKEQRKITQEEKLLQQNRWTIDRLWDEYKSRRPELKKVDRDDARYNKHIRPRFGHKEPAELTQFEVDKMRVTLLKDRAPQTVKLALALLKRIINFGVKKQLCEGISFHIELPMVDNLKTEDLSPAQLQRLLEAIEADPNIQVANLMKLALFTGMRRGELFRLTWDDVDFQRGFLTLREPKGGREQKIPLNTAARSILESHPRTDGSPYIFPGRDGKERTEIIKQANRIKDRAGLPKDFRALHGLRHVFASILASSGQVDMYTLQRLLTHKSPVMTQRYAHLRDDTLKKASNIITDLIALQVSNANASSEHV